MGLIKVPVPTTGPGIGTIRVPYEEEVESAEAVMLREIGAVVDSIFHQRGKHDQRSHGAWAGEYRELPASGAEISVISDAVRVEGVLQNGGTVWITGDDWDRVSGGEVEAVASAIKAADQVWPLAKDKTTLDVHFVDYPPKRHEKSDAWVPMGDIRNNYVRDPVIYVYKPNAIGAAGERASWRAGPQVDANGSLQAVMVHEYGHVQNSLVGRPGHVGYRADLELLSDVSEYGQTNPREAIAESFTEFVYMDGNIRHPNDRGIAQHYGWGDAGKVAPPSLPPPTVDPDRIIDLEAFHQRGTHDQKSHGKWAGGLARPGMGDIPIDEKRASDMIGGSAGPHMVQNADGTWSITGERQALHDQIIEDKMEGHVPVEDKDFFIMGGGPASGKSTLVNSEAGAEMRAALVVEADEMKAMLPEYAATGDPSISAFVHEESSYLAGRLQAAGIERGHDVTLDGMGDSTRERLVGKMAQARANGYAVHGRYVTVDVDTAIFRNEERGRRTGRMVPVPALRAGHAAVSSIVAETYGEFDDFELWDSSEGGFELVMSTSQRGGPATIHNQGAWDRFLAKGNG